MVLPVELVELRLEHKEQWPLRLHLLQHQVRLRELPVGPLPVSFGERMVGDKPERNGTSPTLISFIP